MGKYPPVQEELPLCKTINGSPNRCDPKVSKRACYALMEEYTSPQGKSVEIEWACSKPETQAEFTSKGCRKMQWQYESKSSRVKSFVAPAPIYDGACRFEEPLEPAIPKKPEEPPIPEELPFCETMIGSPNRCDTEVSKRACYSTMEFYQAPPNGKKVPIQWACSEPGNEEEFTDKACLEKEWHFEPTGGRVKAFVAPAGIYEGACQFKEKEKD